MSDTDLSKAGEFTPGPGNNPALALAFYIRGKDLADAGDLDAAISDYNAALTINPMFAAAMADRGVAWARKGDYDRAIADYDAALRIIPRDAKTKKNRAVALERKHQAEGRDAGSLN
ncbi:MAG: tetratricopeptide repeat protein [Burkholderiales bacterium]